MSRIARMLAPVVDVRGDEVRAMLFGGLYFFFLLASYFVLRPIRDTMGVAAGVSKLPWLFAATLITMLACQPLYAALVTKLPVRRFIPITYQFFAINLLLFWLAFRGAGDVGADTATTRDVWIGRAFWVWTSVFNLFVPSVFWSFMADVFRSDQAKRLFGFIGVGGTLGSIVGSAVTASLVERLGTANLLLVSFVLLEIATFIVTRFPRPTPGGPAPELAASSPRPVVDNTVIGGGIWSWLTDLGRSPYLLGIAAFLMLYTIGSSFVYFLQADIIGTHFKLPAERTRILAEMEFAAQLITVLTQIFLTGRIIRWLGMAGTLAVMPALSVVGFLAIGLSTIGLIPALGAIVAFGVLRRGVNFALTNPAMEVLYTVVPREDKYKAKSFIETFVYRAGDQVGAWSFAGLTALGFAKGAVAWPGAVLSVVFLLIGVWLGRRHRQLAAATGT